ncbi:hypothetical protein IKA15_05755 [bacterium]|nr:hypothetical protein [bacterium]
MLNNTKKILVVGMPDMVHIVLTRLKNAGFNIVGLVPPARHNPSFGNAVACANQLGIPVYPFENSINNIEFIKKIAELEADIGLICSYDTKLSRDFLKTTANGYINCHPSLLPNYRGANPYYHIIKNGETMTGVTLHFADEHFDTGDIIMQKSLPLEKGETMGTLFNRTNYMIADCLVDVLKNFEINGYIKAKSQEWGDFPKAPRVPNNIFIDFSEDIETIERQIRAANPFFNIVAFYRGIMIRIITADARVEEHDFIPGEITKTLGEVEIAFKNGFLLPKIIQVGTWGIFDIKDFIEKFSPRIGERINGNG